MITIPTNFEKIAIVRYSVEIYGGIPILNVWILFKTSIVSIRDILINRGFKYRSNALTKNVTDRRKNGAYFGKAAAVAWVDGVTHYKPCLLYTSRCV